MEYAELVISSFIAQAPEPRNIRALTYMPSLNSCLYLVNRSEFPLQILDLNARSVVQRLAVEDDQEFQEVIALSSDCMLLASSVDSENDLPTQVRLSRLAIDANDSECARIVDFCYIERDFSSDNITCIKFSPGGEKIFVTIYRQEECRRGAWLRMYEVPDNLWSKKSEIGQVELAKPLACDEENAQDRYAENNDLQKISEKADEKEAFGSRAENLHQIDRPFY